MVVVLLPSQLENEAGGQRRFEVEAETARAALHELPVADLLFDERGVLRPLVRVYVDGEDARDGLDEPLALGLDDPVDRSDRRWQWLRPSRRRGNASGPATAPAAATHGR